METKTIGVLGAGTMGNGIAQVAAQAGLKVIMRDISERVVEAGLNSIDRFLSKSVEKAKVTREEAMALARSFGKEPIEVKRDSPAFS